MAADDHSAANAALNLCAGTRIEVFWPLDAAWYSGTITALNGQKGVVDYDDGEAEAGSEVFATAFEHRAALTRPPPRPPPTSGDIEELNLATEQMRLLGAEGEGLRLKRHKPNGSVPDAPAPVTAAQQPPSAVDGGEEADGSPDGAAGGDGGERLLVRFANPHATKPDALPPAAPQPGGAPKPGGSVGRPPTQPRPPHPAPPHAAPPPPRKSHKAGGGGVTAPGSGGGGGNGGNGGAPPPAPVTTRDRGASAATARTLVQFSDDGAPSPRFLPRVARCSQRLYRPFSSHPPGPPPCAAPYGPSDAAAVRGWLSARGFARYAPLFEANEVRAATHTPRPAPPASRAALIAPRPNVSSRGEGARTRRGGAPGAGRVARRARRRLAPQPSPRAAARACFSRRGRAAGRSRAPPARLRVFRARVHLSSPPSPERFSPLSSALPRWTWPHFRT